MSNEYDNHSHDELVAVIRGLDAPLTSAESTLVENGAILEAVGDALDGKETSDFMESFSLVLKARDVYSRAESAESALAAARKAYEDEREGAHHMAGVVLEQKAALAAAREENERLRDRIERAQERLDRDPAGNPNYLALSADLRGEIGRVGGVPQYDSAALRRADDAALQGVGARDEVRVERVAKWMRHDAFDFPGPERDFDQEWNELDEGEREAWKRDARAVLAAADGEPRGEEP